MTAPHRQPRQRGAPLVGFARMLVVVPGPAGLAVGRPPPTLPPPAAAVKAEPPGHTPHAVPRRPAPPTTR